ncbi:hypothetical protein F5972_08550 [Microbispora cellulosiformans]|uniref:SWIM-type domain-containing protein n=1 Tax=Microbispora cellulosiformans TaxID=2614688 RepID=A0A5J5K513_9ACTN|nr:DUF6011 domain-containing protein [Microbispora cellulosiformans]KAA9379691.1 hypothetical protein F5972_08550 [Microbispora cellulosiformans]
MDVVKCLDCGRALRSARSIADRRGPRCKAKVRAAARVADLREFTPVQVDKAREVIELGGLLPTRRPTMWTVVSSDGEATYLTAVQACTCPAGRRQRRCYHRAGAAIMAAARGLRAA